MSKADAANQGRVEGSTFDPSALMSSIITTVDRFRSDVGTMPSQVVLNTKDIQIEEMLESRLNCFYRLIGLPATRDISNLNFDEDETNAEQRSKLSQHGTLNYFNMDVLLDGKAIGSKLSARETALTKAIKSRTVETNIQMLKDPLPLEKFGLDQVLDTKMDSVFSDKPITVVRRVSIFPMMVDAATPVFPINKKVAPLFNDGDFVVSGSSANTRLPRPFLESVLYMRTHRSEEDSDTQGFVDNIQTYVQGLPANIELSAEQVVERDSLLAAIGIKNGQADYTLIEAEIISKFVQAIGQSAKKYKESVNKAKELLQMVDFKPEPKSSANEKSGNSNLRLGNTGSGPSIDKRIRQLEQAKSKSEMLLMVLPTNQVLQADTTYRIVNSQEGFANITPDVFVSEFAGIITFDQASIDKKLREEKANRARHIQSFEIISRDIQYYSGEGQGLSIFDVLCTFLALFTIDLDKLVALLNDDALSRMLSNKFFSFNNSGQNDGVEKNPLFTDAEVLGKLENVLTGTTIVSVEEALEELESLVKSNFQLAAAFFKEADRAGQNKKG